MEGSSGLGTGADYVTFAANGKLYAHWNVDEASAVTGMKIGAKDGKMVLKFRAAGNGAEAVQLQGTERLPAEEEDWLDIGEAVPVDGEGNISIDDVPVPEEWQSGFFRVGEAKTEE